MAVLGTAEQLRRERQRNDLLEEENKRLNGLIEYIAVCDHPEMLEEEDDE